MSNKEIYRVLCDNEPSIPIYSKSFWLDAVCGEDNWDVLLYEKGNNILGSLPYCVKKKFGMRYIKQPPFSQHNGAWIKYPKEQQYSKRISFEKEVLAALIEQIEKLHICYYKQNHSPMLTNWLPFYWNGYQQTTYYTYRIEDISDMEVVFQNFQHNKRKNINKARKSNFQVKFDLPADIFYEYHKKFLAAQNRKISYSLELFQRMYKAAYEHDAGRTIYLTNENEELLCALFNLWDANMGYDLISAIDPSTRNSGAPDLLVYSMIEYLSGKVAGYDFEGSMLEGVEESFRHFGAVQVPYFSIQKIYPQNPFLKYLINKKVN